MQYILKYSDEDVSSARLRNMALNKISMDIECNQLHYPFNERPSIRSYTELIERLKSELNENKYEVENEKHDEVIIYY